MFSALRLVDLNYLESVKPTLQRQGHVGLLLNIKQTFALLTDGRLKSTQSSRSLENKKPTEVGHCSNRK